MQESEKRGAGCDGLRRVLADCRSAASDEGEKAEAGGEATPAALPLPEPSAGEEEKEGNENNRSEGEEDESGEESSSIAEDLVAGLKSMSPDEPHATSTSSSGNLPPGKLRWAYAQLEQRLKSKKEPPEWLLQLVMRNIDHEAQFERVSDFQSDEISPELTAAVNQQCTLLTQLAQLTPMIIPLLMHPLLPLLPIISPLITIRPLLGTPFLLTMLLLALTRMMRIR